MCKCLPRLPRRNARWTCAVACGALVGCSSPLTRQADEKTNASTETNPGHDGGSGIPWSRDALPPDPQPPKPLEAQVGAPPCSPPQQMPALGPIDVAVEVRSGRGPHGATEPIRVDRRLYGMNIADWRPQDYLPTPSSSFVTMLAALGPGVLRWPAGHRSQEYVWERDGAGQSGSWELTPAHVDALVALAKAVGAEPLVGINVKRGTVAAATDLVHDINVERGFAVRWFYIGNEPDLTDGMTAGPDAYADQLVAYADAMRAVDPNIRIVGPELLTGAHVGGLHGTVDWMTPIAARAGTRLSGMSWHYYPLDSAQPLRGSSATISIAHLFQETAPDWHPAGLSFADEVMPALAALRDAHAPQASTWITEFAEDPGPGAGSGVSDTLAGGLWVC